MILGIGSDICDIRRVEKTLGQFGERFLQRVFTLEEQERAARRKEAGVRVWAGTLAKRFAAKEAASKALGTGFRRGVFHRDLGVASLPSGQPVLRLSGGAKQCFDALVPLGMETRVHLTMTDEYPYAAAYVLIEAFPRQSVV